MGDENKHTSFSWHIQNVITKCWIVVTFLTMPIFTIRGKYKARRKNILLRLICFAQIWIAHNSFYALHHVGCTCNCFPWYDLLKNTSPFYCWWNYLRHLKCKDDAGSGSDFFHCGQQRTSRLLLRVPCICSLFSQGRLEGVGGPAPARILFDLLHQGFFEYAGGCRGLQHALPLLLVPALSQVDSFRELEAQYQAAMIFFPLAQPYLWSEDAFVLTWSSASIVNKNSWLAVAWGGVLVGPGVGLFFLNKPVKTWGRKYNTPVIEGLRNMNNQHY